MPHPALTPATTIAAVPPGAWAVGVSGGADSVALLALLREARRADLHVHAVHFDHETRNGASADDAAFVRRLCAGWGVRCTVRSRSELEPTIDGLPVNRSARFRALRLALFREVCAAHDLAGVILAHHADDQAETVVQRLLRGAGGPAGLTGMRPRTTVGGLAILRPLLGVPSRDLRDWLGARGQPWREDASNASPDYQRNRVRAVLQARPSIADAARELAGAMADLNDWGRAAAPPLGEAFATRDLADIPDALATAAARQWLADRGAPRDELLPAVLSRLIDMARDAATPSRRHFPGGVLIARSGRTIRVVE